MKYLLLLFVTIAAIGCKPEKPSTTTEPTTTEQLTTQVAKSDITGIEKTAGQKPSEAGLFETYKLYPRIEKMLGKEFVNFKSDWNTESPIEFDGEVLYFYGCKKDKCTDNRYLILIDKTLNTINIYNFKGNNSRAYEEEKNIIGLSGKVSEYFEKIRNEQRPS